MLRAVLRGKGQTKLCSLLGQLLWLPIIFGTHEMPVFQPPLKLMTQSTRFVNEMLRVNDNPGGKAGLGLTLCIRKMG